MINDILDFSQISNGKLRLNYINFPVGAVVKEVTKLIKFQAKKKGLKFEFVNKLFTSDKSTDMTICSDPNRLKQILLNLLGNALKFTSAGFLRITIERISEGIVHFQVDDSGCGIKKEDIGKLFRLFGKLETDESMNVNQTGVGLGLAISQSLVRLLNRNMPDSEIKVHSELGKGSSFFFRLISKEKERMHTRNQARLRQESKIYDDKARLFSEEDLIEEDEEYMIEKSGINSASRSLNFVGSFLGKLQENGSQVPVHRRILIVDDDQINILVATNYLQQYPNFLFEVAYNGAEAVETVVKTARQKIYFDAILMDCNMPVLDGFEATKRILDLVQKEVIPYVPIIAATANASQNDYENCFKAGMIEYISKPFKRQELFNKLNIVFEKKYHASLQLSI
jgi:CheY-like chemotaxis protein